MTVWTLIDEKSRRTSVQPPWPPWRVWAPDPPRSSHDPRHRARGLVRWSGSTASSWRTGNGDFSSKNGDDTQRPSGIPRKNIFEDLWNLYAKNEQQLRMFHRFLLRLDTCWLKRRKELSSSQKRAVISACTARRCFFSPVKCREP